MGQLQSDLTRVGGPWLNGRSTWALRVIVAALVWVSVSSGIGAVQEHLSGEADRAARIAAAACSTASFYNVHKGECDALIGQSRAVAEK